MEYFVIFLIIIGIIALIKYNNSDSTNYSNHIPHVKQKPDTHAILNKTTEEPKKKTVVERPITKPIQTNTPVIKKLPVVVVPVEKKAPVVQPPIIKSTMQLNVQTLNGHWKEGYAP